MKTLFTVLATLVLSFSPFARNALALEITFKSHAKLVKTLTLEELMKKAHVQSVKLIEPHEMISREYVGFSANALFTAIYGPKWMKAEEVLFTCLDGYQPSIPVSRFLKYKGYLVFKRADSGRFRVTNKLQDDEKIELGPLYLVWDNRHDAYLKMMGANDWPYQITSFDLIRFSDRFPKMAPSQGSKAAVKRGFVAFRQFCMTCHSINGEGGKKAMDLNFPKSVTQIHNDAWLRKWISNPTSLRPGTTMPALNRALPNRATTIHDIILYLKAMASQH